ncbi:MAG TPA: hypothetical protein VGP85_03135 [Pyrinomonadaceae bacterium]|nr:hypothetical protein [Pyrinomonadaceae bacterium]
MIDSTRNTRLQLSMLSCITVVFSLGLFVDSGNAQGNKLKADQKETVTTSDEKTVSPSAKDVRGATPYVAIENEPPRKLTGRDEGDGSHNPGQWSWDDYVGPDGRYAFVCSSFTPVLTVIDAKSHQIIKRVLQASPFCPNIAGAQPPFEEKALLDSLTT